VITLDKLEKEKLIKKELQKLNKFFKDIPKEKQTVIQGLKEQAAFMYATLFELQEQLNVEGAVELYRNGSQEMLREHPASKVYNAMIKNYASAVKQLIDLLPKQEGKAQQTEDALLSFIKKAK
jgi:stalled ribosome rescue protein Dom34